MLHERSSEKRVGYNWGKPRKLVHVGPHKASRTKTRAANRCAHCGRPLRDGVAKVNILGYSAAHFHADCFTAWASMVAEEAKEKAA